MAHAIEKAGYIPGKDIFLAIDTAASNLYDDETKTYRIGRPRRIDEVIALYESWISKYPLISIEDGVGERDREGWIALTKALGKRVQLVGDDNVVTNPVLIKKAVADKIANAMLIKPNQIGTVTETMEAIELTKKGRLQRSCQPQVGGDRRYLYRGPRGCRKCRFYQDRGAVQDGQALQIQPADEDRGRSRRRGEICRRGFGIKV